MFRFTKLKGRIKALFANGWDWICKIPKKNFLKINLNIFTFYITSITFQIKKLLQNKNFHFFIQNILTFFLISIKSATISIHFFQSSSFPNTAQDISTNHIVSIVQANSSTKKNDEENKNIMIMAMNYSFLKSSTYICRYPVSSLTHIQWKIQTIINVCR
jgi:hypothetical protein